jgi:hypothetical protein
MAGIDNQSSVGSMNSDLDHSKVEHCFQEFYTEVNKLQTNFLLIS